MSDLVFKGVRITERHYVGTIDAHALMSAFRQHWIPDFQRERIMNRRKINSLREIFQTKKEIDALKISYRGQWRPGANEGEIVMDGSSGYFSIIDGQQRLMALLESGVDEGYMVPFELYLGLRRPEEIRLFDQFNRKATRLNLTEHLNACTGDFTRLLRNAKNDSTYPVRIVSTRTGRGLTFAFLSGLAVLIHRQIFSDTKLVTIPKNAVIYEFFNREAVPEEVALVERLLRSAIQAYVDLVGPVDPASVAWRPIMANAAVKLIIQHFMTPDGGIDYGMYEARIKEIPTVYFGLPSTKEIVSGYGGRGAIKYAECRIIDFINHRRSANKVPYPDSFIMQKATLPDTVVDERITDTLTDDGD